MAPKGSSHSTEHQYCRQPPLSQPFRHSHNNSNVPTIRPVKRCRIFCPWNEMVRNNNNSGRLCFAKNTHRRFSRDYINVLNTKMRTRLLCLYAVDGDAATELRLLYNILFRPICQWNWIQENGPTNISIMEENNNRAGSYTHCICK